MTSEPSAEFGRPDGVEDGFEPRVQQPAYAPPPPTVPPEQQAVFGRPQPDAVFAPLAGERLTPRPMVNPAVPWMVSDTFRPTLGAREGFDPAPGTRIPPSGTPP